ncbi:MAG: hypothetical protein EA412_05345 [Chitinophagaceae bacterium]|nr:MAG: hypothetical protein EA412_05345 [Chitinophagaceae bacterium]
MESAKTISSRDVKFFDYYLFFLFSTEVYVNFSAWPFFSYLRGMIIVSYILWLFFTTIKPLKHTAVAIILIFIIYSAALVLFSSNQFGSFYQFSRIFPSLLVFPITINLFDYQKAKYILKVFANLTIVIGFYLILASILGIGGTGYQVEDDYFTRGGLNSASQFYITILAPALLFFDFIPRQKKALIIITALISILFLITGMKRTSIILIIISLFIYLIFTEGRFKLNYVRFLIIAGSIAFLTSAYWLSTFQKRYEHRAELMVADRDVFEREGRTVELEAVLTEIFSFNDLNYSFFGRSPFVTAGQYGKIGGYYFGSRRPIHNDFAMLLNSLGLTGMLIYLAFLWLVFIRLIKYYKHRSKIEDGKMFFLIFSIIFITSLLNMYNGSFYGTGNRTIVMFFLGLLFVKPVFKEQFIRTKPKYKENANV